MTTLMTLMFSHLRIRSFAVTDLLKAAVLLIDKTWHRAYLLSQMDNHENIALKLLLSGRAFSLSAVYRPLDAHP